ncbi:MAG: hypothetical protein IJ814_02880, partial [Paludibacteraceae bacterium]|nr:hypothetical protein [Paludibacteraceae bacterium]
GVSPGWWTAVLMCAYAIWAIVVINRHIDYDGIEWLWGVLYFIGGFLCMEVFFQRMLGTSIGHIRSSALRFLKERFGK